MSNYERVEPKENNQEESSWDSLKEVPFKTAPESSIHETSPTPPSRQQRKMIASLLSNDYSIINQHDAEITQEEYSDALYIIYDSKVDDFFKTFVSETAGPLDRHSPEDVFEKCTEDKHLMRILAYMTGISPYNFSVLNPHDLNTFIQTYPNPYDFEEESKDFLQMIKNHNSPEKYQEYLISMQKFKYTVYGKKQEYWDSAMDLQKIAEEYCSNQPLQNPNQTGEVETEVTTLSNQEKQRIIEHTIIDGDPVLIDGEEVQLTPSDYEQANLGPNYEVRIGDRKIYFSNLSRIGNRNICIGYVETPNGEIKTRSYYRSNSAGLWRYLPDYTTEGKGWFGKAYSQESLTLPFQLQNALDSIPMLNPDSSTTTQIESLFHGTAKRYKNIDEYSRLLFSGQLRGDYYREIERTPDLDYYSYDDYYKTPPEKVVLPSYQMPNFDQEISNIKTSNRLYGEYETHVFPSKDQKLLYSICERIGPNGETQVWIGGVECDSPITSTGLRSHWTTMGDVATPLYEYRSENYGYGDPSDAKGNYENMWENYLSKMPIIQEYLKSKSRMR